MVMAAKIAQDVCAAALPVFHACFCHPLVIAGVGKGTKVCTM